MSEYQVAYLPIGVPTFHLESAQAEFEKSVGLLTSLSTHVVCPQNMLLTIEELNAFLDTISPQLLIIQNITFANAAYASQIRHRFSCPTLLWTLREPVIDGGRLRLNSLTGAYSAANAMQALGDDRFAYVFGAPEEEAVIHKIHAFLRAGEVYHKLQSLKMAAVGHTPQGFGFGRALDSELLHTFGVTLESIETRELMEKVVSYTEEECADYRKAAERAMVGLENTPAKNRDAFVRLYKAYDDYVKANRIGALSSRCWPDFFTAYGTPVCSVLAMLNDNLVASACESDVYGALSMYIGTQLTGLPTFFGDPVSLDEAENTITYWHCGTAACSLARADTGAQVGVHPNRKIGPTMEFGCRPAEQATVFRVGRKPDGTFRLLILPGRALDKPKQFCGTSVVVQPKADALRVVESSVKAGWEPHFTVIYRDVKDELLALADMLRLEAEVYE